LQRIIIDGHTRGFNWSPDGKKIAVVQWDGRITIYSFEGNDPIKGEISVKENGRIEGNAYDLHWGNRTKKFYVRDDTVWPGTKIVPMSPDISSTAVVDDELILVSDAEGTKLKGKGYLLKVASCSDPDNAMIWNNEKVLFPADRRHWDKRLGMKTFVELDIETGIRRFVYEVSRREPVQSWSITCSPDGQLLASIHHHRQYPAVR